MHFGIIAGAVKYSSHQVKVEDKPTQPTDFDNRMVLSFVKLFFLNHS